MAQLLVLYRDPTDPAAFDAYYAERHVPLARTIPGLRRYEVSRGPVATPAGPSGIHLVATLHFESLAAIQAAFASPEGRAADVATFATSGVEMLFEAEDV